MSFITSTILILCTAIQLSGSEFRVIRGLLTDDRGEILIGATIFEYGNMMNFVLSDVNGEFEIKIPKQEEVVLRITYGCSAFYDVLYSVKEEDKYLEIQAYTRDTDRNTKRIRRKVNRRQKKSDKLF